MIFVDKPVVSMKGGDYIISSHFHTPDKSYDIWYKTSVYINISSDIFLIASLIPAMKLGENLHIEGEISKKLSINIEKVQDIISTWYPEMKRIKIQATVSEDSEMDLRGDVASFFSGGVDSFYTLLKHAGEITKIIYVDGYDVWLKEKKYLDMVHGRIDEIAKEFNKEVIYVSTNIHEFSEMFVDWSHHYFGTALGTVACLLSNSIGKVYIPASHSYKYLVPAGSHPLLDILWSTEKVEVIHDGCEATRNDKIKSIYSNPIVLKYLRVCTGERIVGRDNCGKCMKCIGTMIGLYPHISLENCPTFKLDEPLTTVISNMNLDNEYKLSSATLHYKNLPEGEVKKALLATIQKYNPTFNS